jgi:hypothetical protein
MHNTSDPSAMYGINVQASGGAERANLNGQSRAEQHDQLSPAPATGTIPRRTT